MKKLTYFELLRITVCEFLLGIVLEIVPTRTESGHRLVRKIGEYISEELNP